MSEENKSNTIKVSQIQGNTTEKELRDFFTFCGKISKVELEGTDPKTGTITFDKPTAANTALLLNDTALNGQSMKVEIVGGSKSSGNGSSSPINGDVRQEDKPRAAIFAEMLAHGYSLSDAVLERGIDFDKKNGISERLTSFVKQLDQKYKVTDNLTHADKAYHVTDTFSSWYSYVYNYLNQTLETPAGKKVRNVYDVTAVRVKDIHDTAKEIQNKKNGGKTGVTASSLESAVEIAKTTATPPEKKE